MQISRNRRLLISGGFAVLFILLSETVLQKQVLRDDVASMEQARGLAQNWLEQIHLEKQSRGIPGDLDSNIPYQNLLGIEYSAVTTTLGSRQAKELSTNPEFSALVVRLLHEAGIDASKRVGVTLSGSFPALGISTLAALQTMGIEAVIFSSLGASSFGANQPGSLWIDYERWLRERGGLRYRSLLVTYGGENDNGSAIYPEGIASMDSSLQEYGEEVYIPLSLEESIAQKTQILSDNTIALLINVGGNQASMGACSHALEIPPGLNFKLPHCEHKNRGLILGMNAKGIPIIQLLNLRELALRYDIRTNYGDQESRSEILYFDSAVNKQFGLLFIIVLSLCVWWIKTATE